MSSSPTHPRELMFDSPGLPAPEQCEYRRIYPAEPSLCLVSTRHRLQLARLVTDGDGPRSELTHWKLRAQKFSTSIEQLQRPDLRKVVGVLKEAKNNNDDAASTMKRWRVLDNEVTDAANEEKNLKYLGTLDKDMDVL